MLRFADDIAIIAQSEISLKRALESLDDILESNYKMKGCCATNRKVAGSIPDGFIGFFIDIKSL